MERRFSIGIDLGTTNCVLAYCDLQTAEPVVQVFRIPQTVSADQVESLISLASFLYLHDDAVSDPHPMTLPGREPWLANVGEWARRRSAEAPEQVVSSAKSWLCHSAVDRHSDLLPWGAEDGSPRVSPVVACTLYLRHLIEAWDRAHPEHPLDRQQVTITLPASFDLAARELTKEAALAAGIPGDFRLLEEPQAAVYAWIASEGDSWRKSMKKKDRLLVCDIGGGTTDLTLIEVEDQEGELGLRRIAVGNHLLVGGDNMDLAVAHFAAQRFAERGTKLNAWQSISLWHTCRNAKEELLSGSRDHPYTISVLGRGSRLIGGTVSTEVVQHEMEEIVLEGFFPRCPVDAVPTSGDPHGFLEMGLPYEQDPAITHHLAHFLSIHRSDPSSDLVPGRVLFNGGVLKAKAIRQRILDCLADWGGMDRGPEALGQGEDLDLAVARGAAHYGWTKSKGGLRIRSGTARSYYVGVESAGLAVPGMVRPLQALCVAPLGMEEGTESDVPGREVGLVLGQLARFRFFASAFRPDDRVGQLLRHWDEDQLQETSPMELMLDASEAGELRVPVKFHCKITELGTLELWCYSTRDDRRWKLELNVRESDAHPRAI